MSSGFGDSGQSAANTSVFPTSFGTGGASIFNSVTSVPQGATVDLLTYIVPVGKAFFMQMIEVGGNNIAKYDIEVDGQIICTSRTWFSGGLVSRLRFDGTGNVGVPYAQSSVIKIKVTHYRPVVGDFEARITGVIK